MTIDPIIHVGDILVAIATALLTAIGWGLRKLYHTTVAFLTRVDGYDDRIERAAKVVDVHTAVLQRSGWAQNVQMPRVSQRRRAVAPDEGLA